jgi:hypothetical protein
MPVDCVTSRIKIDMKALITLGLLLASIISSACPVNIEADANSVLTSLNFTNQNLVLTGGLSTVTLAEYNDVIAKVIKIFTPIFAKQKLTIYIQGNWKDSTLKALSMAANTNVNSRYIYISGGYARNNLMNRDVLLQVACHEIGHHLGGYPRKPGHSWPSSAEAQADYYSTSKCMKLVLADEIAMNEQVANSTDVPEFVKDDCSKQFETKESQNICVRIAMSSERKAKSYVVEDIVPFINLNNMSNSVTSVMNFEYPHAQCRLASMYQGALCNVDPKIVFSSTEELTGSCHPKNGHELGARPLCWFLPKE